MTKRALRFGIIESELSDSTWKVWTVLHIIYIQDLTSSTKVKGHFFKGISVKDLQFNYIRALVFGSERDGSGAIYECALELKSRKSNSSSTL